MDKVFVAQNVANKLFATENSIDKAMTDASQLIAELLSARQQLEMSAIVGDEAICKTSQAIATLSEARRIMVEAHKELDDTRLRIGIRTKLGGIGGKTDARLPATDLQRAS